MSTTNDILNKSLVGRQLSAVTFVMDYFQFHFDDSRLTVYSLPIATTGEPIISNFRDRLCAFIGRDVTFAEEVLDIALNIDFGTFGRITIPLDEESRVTVEVAELSQAGTSVLMW
ncbi:hypothetical protein GCM10009552_41820 [Rothia nasimurium]|uniref:Uncharacterized protein n=1 Tax=Luteibacter anthropi TaxID=564369 RepID=A0A7X5ZI08_9GAMM|nr:hypothetical protein [Luteibacter anthropi]NII06352.1 hypothetical protein [Luteibacter anthropi]